MDVLLTLAFGLLLAALSLAAGGGLQLDRLGLVEVGLIVVGAVLAATALLLTRGTRLYGLGLTLAFGALLLVTAISISWAVQPDDAWIETNRTLAYLGALVTGIALARLLPGRWSALVGGIVVASTLLSLYALATKTWPATLNPDETYARLREPFGYWNAVGLMAVIGMPGTLWLGARRTGHMAVSALAFPIMGVLVLTTLLTFSRGSLLAGIVGLIVWFALSPLRLRSAAILVAGIIGGGMVTLWAFAQDALTEDAVPLGLRTAAGHQLGVLVVALVLVLAVVGLAVGFGVSNRAPRTATRRRAGIALLVCLALVPLGVAARLALSDDGFGGSISKGWDSLTDADASTPANTPGRLTAVASVRARYYDESLKLFRADELKGVGAGGYATARARVRTNDLDVLHSHGYLFQTLADLGLLGLAASLAATLAFLLGAARTLRLDPRRGRPPADPTPERIGTIALLCVVLIYGVHSALDWTWFIPGPTALALIAAGWIVGRGPLPADRVAASVPRPRLPELRVALRSRPAAVAAAATVVLGLLLAWTTLQPQRAVSTGEQALNQLVAGKAAEARRTAERAADIDPLSVEPLYELAAIESSTNRLPAARAALQRAVALQPRNPAPWIRLADFELNRGGAAPAALTALGPALYLDPRSAEAARLYVAALRSGG